MRTETKKTNETNQRNETAMRLRIYSILAGIAVIGVYTLNFIATQIVGNLVLNAKRAVTGCDEMCANSPDQFNYDIAGWAITLYLLACAVKKAYPFIELIREIVPSSLKNKPNISNQVVQSQKKEAISLNGSAQSPRISNGHTIFTTTDTRKISRRPTKATVEREASVSPPPPGNRTRTPSPATSITTLS